MNTVGPEQMMAIVALHRYWLNANLLKEYFQLVMSDDGTERLEALQASTAERFFPLTDCWILMGYWYAALYVVVEGYRDLGLSAPEIDELLGSPHVDRLRRFRNGMFHFQKEWLSPKLEEIHQDVHHVDWIRDLHSKLGKCLVGTMKSVMPKDKVAEIEESIEELKKAQPPGPPYLSTRALGDLTKL